MITKGELSELNHFWKDAKTKGLSKESTGNYLYLKIKVTNHVKALEKEMISAHKLIAGELGYKEGDVIPKEKQAEVQSKLNDTTNKILQEEIDLDTRILTFDECYNCLIALADNDNLSTEGKATLVNYLVKE